MSDQDAPDYVTSDTDDYSSGLSEYKEIESDEGGDDDNNNDGNEDEVNDQQESVHSNSNLKLLLTLNSSIPMFVLYTENERRQFFSIPSISPWRAMRSIA